MNRFDDIMNILLVRFFCVLDGIGKMKYEGLIFCQFFGLGDLELGAWV